MKTKLFSLFLALTMSVGTMFAESGKCGDYIYWNLKNGVLTFFGYNGSYFGDGDIWDAMDATSYGSTYAAPWYNYRSSIYSIVIPEGITYIGNCAFLDCYNVQTINLPNTLTGIGHSAFKGCSSLTSITIPEGVTTIKYGTFAGCTKLDSIVIPNSVTAIESGKTMSSISISAGAFQGCTSLTSVTIPNSVTSIGDATFGGCTSLEAVTIPDSVTYLGSYVFAGCSSLASVTIGSSVTSIKPDAFSGCGITSITIPNSVTSIETAAFFSCKNLTSISIGDHVYSIGNMSFCNCTSLSSVTIPPSVVTIEDNAFNSCSSLQRVSFSEGLNLIKAGGFMNCSSLRSIILPNSLDSLGWQCFNLCPSMDTILIGENLRGGQPEFPSAKVVIWNAKNANIQGIPCRYLTIGEKVETLPRSVYNNMTPDTITCYPTYPPAIYPTEGAGTSGAKANTILHLTDTTYISIPCGTLNNYTGTTGWGNYRKNMHERVESGCVPTPRTYYTVTFRDWDDTVLKAEQVEEGESAMAPANPTREGYTFTGWDKDFSNVQSDLVVTALYTQNTPSTTYYTVTFKDWDGTILKTEQVEEGHSATAPANPTREGYTFVGWDKDFSHVQSDLIVTALYTQNTPIATYYTVTFKDWDGTVLKAEQVEEGHAATAPANPTREGYTFVGWDKDFSHVLSDLTVIALYTQNAPSITYYTVTFKDWNGTVLKAEQVENGKSATAPANPTREGYTFIGWDKSSANVQSDLIVTAQYIQNSPEPSGETMSFVGFESTSENPLSNQIYAENLIQNKVNVTLVETDATKHKYSINLTNGGEGSFTMGGVSFSYTYSQAGKTAYKTYIEYIQPNGADREISIPTKTGEQVKVVLVEACAGVLVNGVSTDLVAGDNVLTSQNGTIVLKSASTKPKISAILPLSSTSATNYTVAFVDWDATVLKTQQVTKGQSATAPANPTREDYTFTGWDKDFSNVQSNLIVIAQYTQNAPTYYTVTFKDWDGTVLKNEQVEKGKSATAPANPTREGYTFVGWDKYFGNVRSDLIVTALYTQNASTYYTVTFKDWDGTVLKTEQVEEGTIPSYTGATPTRQETAEFTYTFAGWTPEIVAATSDATYTATYTATRKSYTITWLQDDGSLIDKTTVEYGQMPTHADPTKAATAEYTYTFAGWTPEIVVVTKDATYTATYEATPVSEGVEDVSADDIAPRKVMIDGNVYILRGEKVYTVQGQEVK